MTAIVPVGDLLAYAMGGGWGDEEPSEHTQPCYVIRGTDLATVRLGSLEGVPRRFESEKRLAGRSLKDGDIILEISGGSKGQPTGRTALMTERLLAGRGCAVIPASFCRLLRPNRDLVTPRYLYYWLQDMYTSGRVWAYQNQSTGIANFQMKVFTKSELVRLPPLEEQERIAGALGAFDDLIETNRRLLTDVLELTRAVYARAAVQATARIALGAVAVANPEKRAPGKPDATLRYLDIGTMTDGSIGEPTSTTWSDAPSRARRGSALGDVLWATVRPNRRAHGLLVREIENLVVSTGIAVLRPTRLPMSLIFAHTDSPRFVETLVGRVDGSAYPAVKAADFLAVHVPDVSKEDIDTFCHVIDPLWLAAGQLEEEAISLTRQRDELLPLLMSGRVRVRDLEAVA